MEPSSKNGQVSNHRTQHGQPFYEISAAATQGMSGGPVVDTQGRIIGVISQGSPGETQSFNLAAVPAGLVTTATLDPARGLPTLTLDPNNRRTEITYDALGRTTEVWLPNRPKASNPGQ